MKRKFWATTFTLTGAIIGAGILGLPYVFSQSGIFIGSLWLIVLGLIMMYTNLCLGEITLKTKGKHHLVGYAEKYLGKSGKRVMFFAVVFGVYSALIAYLIGEGQSLSQLFTGSGDYAIYFVIGFWALMTIMLGRGLKGLKRVELWGVFIIILLVLGITAYYFPQVNVDNFSYNNFDNFFLPFGVVMFALLGFSSIPELRMEIRGSEKLLKKAIILGTIIPIILYILFTFTFVGVLGMGVEQVATLSFGKPVTLLGIFTMLTSYLILTFSLKDIYTYDLKFSKTRDFFLVSLFPLVIYFVLSFFGMLNFVAVLGIGGVISGGLTGIMILLIAKKAKKHGSRKPEYKVPINWFVILLLSLVFIGGIVVQLVF